MFSKLFKKLLSETTNVADTASATFNAPGNYNPKYGKQKVYVSGRGGSGTTSPGYYFDNSYSNPGTYTPQGYTEGNTNTGTYTAGTQNAPYYGWIGWVASYIGAYTLTYSVDYLDNGVWFVDFAQYSFGNYGTQGTNVQYAGPGYAYGNTWPMPSPAYIPAYNSPQTELYGTVPGTWNTGTYTPGNTNPGTTNPASYTPGNYVPGNSGSYATNYTTGTAANILGVTFPGGVGGAATVVPATLIPNNPKYGTTTAITIPSGGYATITFTL